MRGNRANLLDPTAGDLARYYSALLSWLVKGWFVDEAGTNHTGGPRYDLSRAKGHTWELFNEAEHGYTWQQYVHDYDVIVPAMIDAVGGAENAPKFMGIGGASSAWIGPFLNASNHHVAHNANHTPPIDYVSQHFYAGAANRTDPGCYAANFFGEARGFVARVEGFVATRDASSFPRARLDLDELGVIMPGDNDPSLPLDADLPDIYWNAAGAMYAYLFARLAPLGVAVLGQSQLAGSPKIPEWGIPLPQFPSVSLLDWRTGFGNARYWVLKLLIEEFAPGDTFVETRARAANPKPPPGPARCAPELCGTVNGPAYGVLELGCCGAGATISGVDFADWGTPEGSCAAAGGAGNFTPSAHCTTAAKARAWAERQCVGKAACALKPYPSALGDPCVGQVKRLAVRARCTGAAGGRAQSANGALGENVVALGVIGTDAGAANKKQKVLLINTQNAPQQVALALAGAGGATSVSLRTVDPASVQVASEHDGIRTETVALPTPAAPMTLQPFAVAVAVF